MFSPTDLLSPMPTNGIADSIQSAAALAGITDSDALDDQPPLEQQQQPPPPAATPVINANVNQSNNAVRRGNQAVQIANTAQQSVFDLKSSQTTQPMTSFTAPVQSAPTPVQRVQPQPIRNVSPQVNTQPVQQQPTIALPANNSGGGIQLSLTPQQLAAIQQSGGRVQASGNTIQVLPNPMPQPQIVQAIQPNGTPIQLALLPSGVQLGQQFVIRQPLKPGAKLGGQAIMGSPSKTPLNIQPKLTTASPIKPPVSIRPYQVALTPQITSVANSAAPQGNIILQHPPPGQTIQLTNLAQQPSAQGGQNIIIQNPGSGSAGPVVTMGVSHGSIIVMTQTRPSTTASQPPQLTNTVNASSTKPSIAPSPSTAAITPSQSPQPIKSKPAPKKKKSKKKSKEKEKSKPLTSSASTSQSVTAVTTSANQQTTPSVSYTQTYVTSNGQTIVVQAPIKQGDGAVPIVQQINISAPSSSCEPSPSPATTKWHNTAIPTVQSGVHDFYRSANYNEHSTTELNGTNGATAAVLSSADKNATKTETANWQYSKSAAC